ncbi:hypothetical protein OIV83_003759 [Microbotryomycetes sp. JL201]|nr:hypothetical protein OIV83_003759 [Microbotryomycetes sp. JL201]
MQRDRDAAGWLGRLIRWTRRPQAGSDDDNDQDRDLSSLSLMALTVGLAGAQLTWTIEMAFGTPYLLSLGLSKTGTSLVWLAGPLSGLLVQPLIGAISDSSQSRYRRRAFIAGSASIVILSTLLVAYAREIGGLLASWSGLGDWDPEQDDALKRWAIVVGVSGFYVLDFSLNGLQATLRALILDRSPGHQQPVANAWHGRMTHMGNIFGYLAGYIDLGHWSGIKWVGGGQFRKLAVLSCFVMVICVTITCWTQPEKEFIDSPNGVGVKWTRAWSNIKHTIRHLPKPVRQVCFVQFCAWTAWFPFLFYSTSYVTEVLYSTIPRRQELPSADTATRAGSRALLLYAIVALCSGAFLPWLTTLGESTFFNAHCSRTSKKGRLVRRTLTLFTPRNFWSMGLLLYFIGIRDPGRNQTSARHKPASLPFSNDVPRNSAETPPSRKRQASTSSTGATHQNKTGATILGIHNLSIVAPQFLVALVAALIFKLLDGAPKQLPSNEHVRQALAVVVTLATGDDGEPTGDEDARNQLRGKNDVVWVLRFGGLVSLVGVWVSRFLVETSSERMYKAQVLSWYDGIDEEDSGDSESGIEEQTALLINGSKQSSVRV